MALLHLLRETTDGSLVYQTEGQAEAAINRQPVVTLTDAATIAIDSSLGNFFEAFSNGSRNLAVPANPPPAGQSQTITLIWHNTGGGNATLNLLTAGIGAWRIGDLASGVSMANTRSGRKLRIQAVYDPIDQRWDVLAFVNQLQ